MRKTATTPLKRFLAAMLALVMVVSLMPWTTVAYAAETDDTEGAIINPIADETDPGDEPVVRDNVVFPAGKTLYFNGQTQNVVLTVDKLVSGDKLTYTIGENTKTVDITADGSYDCAVEVNAAAAYEVAFTVEAADASVVYEGSATITVLPIVFPEGPVLTYKTEGQTAELQVKQMAAGTVLAYEMGEEKGEVPVGTDGTASVSVPVTNVGNYAVKLAVFAGELELAKADVTVQVVPAPIVGTEIKYGSDCIYDGEEHTLATVTGLQKDDAIVWVVNNVETAGVIKSDENGKYYSEYKEVNAGEYDIIAKITRNDNYEGCNYENGKVTIAKKQLKNVELSGRAVTYNGKCIVLVNGAGEVPEFGKLQYYVAKGENVAEPSGAFGNDNTAVDAGNYTVFYKVVPMDEETGKNYAASEWNSVAATINPAEAKVAFKYYMVQVGDAEPQQYEITSDSATIDLNGDAKVWFKAELDGAYANCYVAYGVSNDEAYVTNYNEGIHADANGMYLTVDGAGAFKVYASVGEEGENYKDQSAYFVLTVNQTHTENRNLLSFAKEFEEYIFGQGEDENGVVTASALQAERFYEADEGAINYKIEHRYEDENIGLTANEDGTIIVSDRKALADTLEKHGNAIEVTVVANKEAGNVSTGGTYAAADAKYLLKISFAELPENGVLTDFVAKEGTNGANGWYVSDVKYTAAEGYTVARSISAQRFSAGSANEAAQFQNAVNFYESDSGVDCKIYVRNSEGGIYPPFIENNKIDTSAPRVVEVSTDKKFFNDIFIVTITAEDETSKVTEFEWKILQNGKEVVGYGDNVENVVTNGNETTASFKVEISEDDFYEGELVVTAKDAAGLVSDRTADGDGATKTFVYDNIDPELTVTRANDGLHHSDGKYYYQEATAFNVSIVERYLSNAESWVYRFFDERKVAELNNWVKSDGDENNITVSVEEVGEHRIEVVGKDEAGNVIIGDEVDGGEYKSPTVVIDGDAPVIEVTYENLKVGYKEDDEAVAETNYYSGVEITVEITERNFDIAQTVIDYEKDGVKQGATVTWICEDEHADHDIHTAVMSCNENGEYQVVVDTTDKSHRNSKSDEPEIIVDLTAPVVEIVYDNNDVRNLKYYNEKRTATVTITETNFNTEYVTIEGIGSAKVSEWKTEGDKHTATIDFVDEGVYTPEITVVDRAGNTHVETDSEFVLDWTIENPVIGGVANGKAYKTGVYPTITMEDINFDEDGYTLRLTRTVLGEHDVDVTAEFLGELETNPQGAEGSFGDFAREQANDGIYTLTATIKDLAGNESSTVVTFSVNRFGSVYKYDSYLASLIKDGGAYVRAVEKDLIITEYNADRLLEGSLNLTITRDGRPVENVKFTATPSVNEFAPLGASGWYQYQYTISKDNFAKDGLYKISVSSEDVAGNTPVNNSGEGMEIVFRVDATPAELTSIVGLEESIVNAAELNVRYTVFDAMGIRSIKVYVDGALVGSEITEFGGDMNNYNGSFTIGESNTAQTVRIVVEDLAGNITDTDAASFTSAYTFNNAVTVSTNVFVRLYANKPLFFGTCAGTAAAAAGIALAISKRRKREEEIV